MINYIVTRSNYARMTEGDGPEQKEFYYSQGEWGKTQSLASHFVNKEVAQALMDGNSFEPGSYEIEQIEVPDHWEPEIRPVIPRREDHPPNESEKAVRIMGAGQVDAFSCRKCEGRFKLEKENVRLQIKILDLEEELAQRHS